jgi:hypothetical protein
MSFFTQVLFKNLKLCQVWWCTPIISVLWRLSQTDNSERSATDRSAKESGFDLTGLVHCTTKSPIQYMPKNTFL